MSPGINRVVVADKVLFFWIQGKWLDVVECVTLTLDHVFQSLDHE